MNVYCQVTIDPGIPSERRAEAERFELREALSSLLECRVEVALDARAAPSPGDGMGVTFGPSDTAPGTRKAPLRHVRGIVRATTDLGPMPETDRQLYRIELVPSLWRLSQRVRNRVYTRLSVQGILRSVLDSVGIYPGDDLVFACKTAESRELCVQFCESELAFVSRLLEEEGLTYRFDVDFAGRERFYVFDDGDRARLDGDLPELSMETVRWKEKRVESRASSIALVDHDYMRSERRVRLGPEDAEMEVYPARFVWPRGIDAFEDAPARAQTRLQAEHTAARMLSGTVEGLDLQLGAFLRHSGDDEPWDQLKVVAVELEGRTLGTRFAPLSGNFRAIPAGTVFRPPLGTPRPRIDGLQSATVVGPQGDEVHTDHLGRVQLRFQWERSDANRPSPWVRVLQGPWAGGGWGHQFIPRVGMEVAVAFMDGDPDRPVVIGALYNATHVPPFDPRATPQASGIRTRSLGAETGGNVLQFDDAAGSERILIQAERDLVEDIKHDQATSVERDQSVRVGRSRRTDVGADDLGNVAGASTWAVEGAVTATSGKKIHVAVAGASFTLTDRELTVEVPGRITLVCGDTRLEMAPKGVTLTTAANGNTVISTGSLEIVGEHARIAARESVSVVGSSTVSVESKQVSIQGEPVRINC